MGIGHYTSRTVVGVGDPDVGGVATVIRSEGKRLTLSSDI